MIAVLRRRVGWTHPEWWALSLAALAWLFIATSAINAASAGHHGHGTARGLRDWLLMVVAMMFPLTVGAIQTTAGRSLWRRRHRAILSWLAGYTAPWLLLGALAVWPAVATSVALPNATFIAGAFVLAAAWQLSPLRARAVSACHRTWPLAPSGWRATRDCASAGWATSVNCVAACGPLMIACWLLGHGPLGLVAMVAATAIGLAERYAVRPDPRLLATVVALHAVTALSFT